MVSQVSRSVRMGKRLREVVQIKSSTYGIFGQVSASISFIGHRTSIFNVSFSYNGKTLASASILDTNLWDTTSGIHKKKYNGYTKRSSALWLNNDEMIQANPNEKIALLSDLMTREVKMELGGHKKSVKSISFSPDGKTMASGSYDTTIRLWSLPAGRYKKTKGT